MALLLSIVCATFLVVCLKSFDRFKIETLPAIVFNYITCIITGIIVSGEFPSPSLIIHKPWFPFAVILGCSFFCIFNLMGFVARNIGVTVTSVASKLSMVIPVTAAIILYHDPFSIVKVISIVIALVAVYLSSDTEESHEKHVETKGMLLAFLIFIGSGMNDSLVNYASLKLMTNDEFNDFNIVIFFFASAAGLLTLSYQMLFQKKYFAFKELAGGIVLGVPNYFSLLFLIEALQLPEWKSSVVFPVNNMGIVVLTAGCAYILFREKLSGKNLIGMGLALVAIALLIFA